MSSCRKMRNSVECEGQMLLNKLVGCKDVLATHALSVFEAAAVIESTEQGGADLLVLHFWGCSNFMQVFNINTVNTETFRALVGLRP